jgi:excisionase family DNA binding protein
VSDLEEMVRKIVRDELAKQATPANDETEQLTVAEYARRWSLGQSTVRAAIREGRLEHVRIGRAVRIPAAAKIGKDVDATTERARLILMRGGKAR